MKAVKLLIYCLLLFSASTFSQNYYDQYSVTRFGGVDRSIAGAGRETPHKPTPEEIEKMRAERVETYMAKMQKDLNLDELQLIAIKNEMISTSKKVDIIVKKEGDTDEAKAKEVKALMDKMEATVRTYLNKDQKEKYEVFIAELSNNKKGKKDKKSGKKEELPELDNN